jgi:hypothetical protein
LVHRDPAAGATLASLFLLAVFGNVEHLGATLPTTRTAAGNPYATDEETSDGWVVFAGSMMLIAGLPNLIGGRGLRFESGRGLARCQAEVVAA